MVFHVFTNKNRHISFPLLELQGNYTRTSRYLRVSTIPRRAERAIFGVGPNQVAFCSTEIWPDRSQGGRCGQSCRLVVIQMGMSRQHLTINFVKKIRSYSKQKHVNLLCFFHVNLLLVCYCGCLLAQITHAPHC